MARAPHQQTAEKRLEKVFRTAESIKEECRLLQRNENGHWSQRGIDLFEGEILGSCKILQLRDEFAEVDKGFDVADNAIVAALAVGDLVITADIPLAAQVIDKGGHALNPRGEFYSAENIKERLSMRDFME